MRVLLRLLSPFLGLAVAGAGGLLVAEVAWRWAGRGRLLPWWPTGLTWTDERVRTAALLTAVAGLLLLVLAMAARRKDVRLHAPADGVVVTTTPTALARVVGHRVRAVEGVSGASVTASRRRVRVRATSRRHDEAALRPRLLDAARAVVRDLPMPSPPKVSVVVDSPKDREHPRGEPRRRSGHWPHEREPVDRESQKREHAEHDPHEDAPRADAGSERTTPERGTRSRPEESR
ncbi:DUF6286 domain-containing protein [Saccharothrix australiensis]|uniref:DUF6286 domain-containing protein n=1 Tax=Saccharothrix australiensis TaxID=2072 RepID=A0A495VYL5_9PSEU|nr:DUF6286 domain-containing protein [Saccharothrix australiensis]RKT53495.1 hypothetical protein C8E97_2060 [Saccharothrix australiensis]